MGRSIPATMIGLFNRGHRTDLEKLVFSASVCPWGFGSGMDIGNENDQVS